MSNTLMLLLIAWACSMAPSEAARKRVTDLVDETTRERATAHDVAQQAPAANASLDADTLSSVVAWTRFVGKGVSSGPASWQDRILACSGSSPWTGLRFFATLQPSLMLGPWIVEQVQQRIDTQGLVIFQGTEGFCGPVSLEYIFALSQPDRYANTMADLFCLGQTDNTTFMPAPGVVVRRCLRSAQENNPFSQNLPEAERIHASDYIFAATLRASVQGLSCGSSSQGFGLEVIYQAATRIFPSSSIRRFGWEMRHVGAVLKGLLGTHHESKENWNVAMDAVRNGGQMIISVGHGEDLRGWSGSNTDHFVVLTRVLDGSDATDQCTRELLQSTPACVVWTWGRYYVYENCDNLRKNAAEALLIESVIALPQGQGPGTSGPRSWASGSAMYSTLMGLVKRLYHARLDGSWDTAEYAEWRNPNKKSGLERAIGVGLENSPEKYWFVPWVPLGHKQKKAGFELSTIAACQT